MDSDGQLKMIKDVLDWPLPPENKLEHIEKVLEEQPAPKRKAAAPAAPAKKRAPSKKTTRPSSRTEPGSRSALWAELKKVAPERAEKLGYNAATKENLTEILQKIKGGS